MIVASLTPRGCGIVAALVGLGTALGAIGISVGLALGIGLANGIRAAIPIIAAATFAAGAAAAHATKQALKVQSPSEVGIETGEFFGQGLAVGIDQLVQDVQRAGSGLGQAAVVGAASVGPVPLGAATAALTVPQLSVPSFGSSGVQEVRVVGGLLEDDFTVQGGDQVNHLKLDVATPVSNPDGFAANVSARVARRIASGGFRSNSHWPGPQVA